MIDGEMHSFLDYLEQSFDWSVALPRYTELPNISENYRAIMPRKSEAYFRDFVLDLVIINDGFDDDHNARSKFLHDQSDLFYSSITGSSKLRANSFWWMQSFTCNFCSDVHDFSPQVRHSLYDLRSRFGEVFIQSYDDLGFSKKVDFVLTLDDIIYDLFILLSGSISQK